MAVIACEPYEAEGGIGEDGQRQWTVVYLVRTNDRNDDPIVVLSSSLIPAFYSPYSFGDGQDFGAYRGAIRAKLRSRDGSMKLWEVTATFSSRALSRPPDAQRVDDPLLLPPEISGDWLTSQEPLTKDKDGNPVVNSAGDLFDGLTRDRSSSTLVIAQTYATINLPLLDSYIDAVNEKPFWLLGPRKWRLIRAPWQQQFRGSGLPYYRVTFEFRSHKDTWDYKPADRGWRYKSGNRKLIFRDDDGMPLTQPGYLDGGGEKLGNSSPIVYYDGIGGNPDPIEGYEPKDFAALGIPIQP